MEIKLDAKLMKAVYGLMIFCSAVCLMAVDFRSFWLVGMFMLFGTLAQCTAWYLDGMKDINMIIKTSFLLLFSIVFISSVESFILGYFVFVLWGMMEAALLFNQKFEAIKAQEGYWFVYAGLLCLAVLLDFVACFAHEGVLMALPLIFVALALVFEYCEQFLPKVSVRIIK